MSSNIHTSSKNTLELVFKYTLIVVNCIFILIGTVIVTGIILLKNTNLINHDVLVYIKHIVQVKKLKINIMNKFNIKI